MTYAWISLGSFVLGLVVLVLILKNVHLLLSHGQDSRFYFIALVPVALSAAVFLFGVLGSFALYRGKHPFGAIDLGGAVVGFALVMIAGFVLPPPASNFPLTVYVHGSAGQQDLPLRSHGAVLLDLGGDRRSAPIGDKGQAFFPEIPASFMGEKVNVALDAPSYERTDNNKPELNGTSLYLEVRRSSARISGTIIDEVGRPIVGAMVTLADVSTTSREQGHFNLMIPSGRVENEMVLRVSASGYTSWSQIVMPNGGPVTAVLRR
jgi:hypothetical protein